jgi:aspartyl-tRNA(Asn)/glutamyl-tRNA(Gln) amidotransferase subunit A
MPVFSDDVFFASAADLHSRWKKREFSAVELARAFCDRLEKLGPRFNALALSLREEALRQAAGVDKELKRERFRTPLQAIPYAVKDLLSVAGHPTAWGARPYAAQVFAENAAVVDRLAKAGAVLTGKLAMVELAGGGGYRYAAASLTGPGLNPWDRTRWSGGSSSGSAAAVAAGLAPYALGSETSGSILTPAAYCGVTGLRPTYGLVSRFGAMPLAWTMDKIGPLAHTAEDCGWVLQAIAGADSRDPGSARKSFYFAPQYARPIKELRVGWAPADFQEYADPEIRPALQEALSAFRSLGAPFVETEIPDLPYSALATTIIGAEAASVFEELISSGRVDELADARQIAGLKAALDIPARDYLRAMRLRRQLQDRFRAWFADFDFLLTPTRFGVATKVSDPLDRPSSRPEVKSRGLRDLIPAGNLAGLPALALPAGFAGGLPVSLSLVGRAFSENTLLAAGLGFQRATSWHASRPRLAD